MAPSESVPVFLPFPGTDHTPPSSPSNTQGKLLVMMLVEVVVVVVAAEVVVLDVVVEVEVVLEVIYQIIPGSLHRKVKVPR